MANIKSAKKRILQNKKRRLRNKVNVSEVRTEIKKLLMLLNSSKDVELLLTQLRKAEKVIDKSAGKGIIHKNRAARTKSRLTRRYNKVTNTMQTDATISMPPTSPSPESGVEDIHASVVNVVE